MAPKNVGVLLWQLQSGLGSRPRDSEAEAALDCLPPETLVCKYESPSQMEAAARSVDDGGYCVFLDVPERIVFNERRQMGIKRTEYFDKPAISIAKMVTRPHEVVTDWLIHEIQEKMRDMGMRYLTYLSNVGRAKIQHKEPDCALLPRNLPSGRTNEWPTLVVEIGKSESEVALDRDARNWIWKSGGDVKVAITAEVSRSKLTVRRYGRSGTRGVGVLQTITVNKSGQSPIRVTGDRLRIPFEDLFLRTPARNQGDFIFTETELQDWAEFVWEHF
ncbi:predicted protein [Uncinocarpus reesii 1704]|uniref:Restriction endonuclease domain-containing protein n=1 Tax=Uncinocarpus reesii (strain UAMH 1704) TaxID=336963 RepID=C4JN99_UNCRE|nr:uncharacterized protein UREG_04305 [Uncinocarpus reesii 1704]EEP79459.1 predicted protein [Uncinocarpus reesii 1704]